MSILRDVIPPRWRKWVYGAYAVGVVLIGGTQLGFATANADQPLALTVIAAVWAYLGGAVGAVAAANVPSPASNVVTWDDLPTSWAPNQIYGTGITPDEE